MIKAFKASFKVVTPFDQADREFTGCDILMGDEGALIIEAYDTEGQNIPYAWYAPGKWLLVDFVRAFKEPQ